MVWVMAILLVILKFAQMDGFSCGQNVLAMAMDVFIP
jgi:hypothetical protein